ncbi:MAG TPA: fused MFS/spermidine synthase [Syntrophorhabdaceae bacterium]|nr:fused MFS/spermidine synthase [Syntrophorhabdaceae bacterium]
MIPRLVFALLVTGLAGIVAQTVIIRESLIIYGGNELSIGVIIGSWVAWEALGAYFGSRWPGRGKSAAGTFVAANILFLVIFPVTIYLVRVAKVLSGFPAEISLGVIAIFCISLVVLLPVSLLHGYSFTAACRVYEELEGPENQAAGRVYFYEMLGTIAGGILVSYVLITRFNSFRAAGLVSLALALACLVFAASLRTGRKRLLSFLSLAAAACSLFFVAFGLDDHAQGLSVKTQWYGRKIVFYRNSPYQNIAVTEEEKQHTFFTDGQPVATLPVPDINRVEEFVHIPLLAHGSPVNVLVLHGGAGGVIGEILKYPTVRRVDHIEIDPLLLAAITRFPSETVIREMADPRLSLHYNDIRRFVQSTPMTYDIVLLGLSAPNSLQTGRLFTAEFFREVKAVLSEKGLFVFTAAGSLAYYDRELQDINASALATARSVFPHVAVVPGSENLFLSSSSPEGIVLSARDMHARLKGYDLKTRLISLPHLTYRLDREKMDWFYGALKPSGADINRDLTPKGLFYNIAFNNALLTPSLKGLFKSIQERGVAAASIIMAVIMAVSALLTKRYRAIPALLAISTTGLVVMLLELSLIFVYQIMCGYVFYEIGMLMTMLMAGMAAGSMAASSRGGANAAKFLIYTEAALAVFCVILFLVLSMTGYFMDWHRLALRILFFVLLFVSGSFAGIEFPLAVKIHSENRPLSPSTGIVYGFDLLGGFIGGLIGGFFLFPLLGVTKSCLAFAAVKACCALLLISRRTT